MNNYFPYIISKLTIDDMTVLGILSDLQVNAVFKSIKKKDVLSKTHLTEANFRKSIYRLEANGFIEIVKTDKEHKIYITEFGQIALNESLNEEEEQ